MSRLSCGLNGSDTAAAPGTNPVRLFAMIYLLLTSGVSLCILALLLWRAPRGWQDADGFHLGDEPAPESTEPPVTAAAEPRKVRAGRKAA